MDVLYDGALATSLPLPQTPRGFLTAPLKAGKPGGVLILVGQGYGNQGPGQTGRTTSNQVNSPHPTRPPRQHARPSVPYGARAPLLTFCSLNSLLSLLGVPHRPHRQLDDMPMSDVRREGRGHASLLRY